MGSSGCTGFGVTAAPAARRLSSAAFCISKVLIVICTKPVFIVSQVSTVLSSLIFFSISSTFAVGVIMPGNGNDSGFHAFCMNSKKSLGKSCSGTANSVNATMQLYHKPQAYPAGSRITAGQAADGCGFGIGAAPDATARVQ